MHIAFSCKTSEASGSVGDLTIVVVRTLTLKGEMKIQIPFFWAVIAVTSSGSTVCLCELETFSFFLLKLCLLAEREVCVLTHGLCQV